MDKFTGKVWVLGDDIDTDIIIPTEYLALKTIDDMKQYGFSPLRPELAGQIQKGDIIVAGKNFGCGSSREQAPEIIKALGIQCVIAKSFVVPSSAVTRSVIPAATASLSASSAPLFNTETVAVSATVTFAFISFTVVGFFSV